MTAEASAALLRLMSLAGWRIRLLLAALVVLGPATAVEATAPAPEGHAIRALIATGALSELRRSDFSDLRSVLDAVYRRNDYRPLWLGADGPPRAILSELGAAPSDGLDTSLYDIAWLRDEIEAIAAGDRAPQRSARVDVALSVAVLRYASDLHGGRIRPAEAGFKLASPRKPLDLAAVLERGIATGDWHEVLGSLRPSLVLYRRLQQALARYRSYASASLPPLPALPTGTRKIVPGDNYAGVAELGERLRIVGDLPSGALPPLRRYDGALVDAVRRFQDRHGLEPDGVIGSATLAELEVPFAARVRQIELSLERLRWLPDFPSSALIAVNIPSFRLWAFTDASEDAAAQLSMPVIVGHAAAEHKTPVFIGEMRYVEFSPYWNIPPGIQRAEIVPRLARDPSYWEREGLEAVPVGSRGDPRTVLDAATLDGLASGALRARQRPGPNNALGSVKFALPNTLDIYLHGTPARQLFGQTRRDFSHGCIRVEDPLALAVFVLSDQPAWTPDRIAKAMAAGKTATVRLTRPIPVVIFYTTAIVDAMGAVRFAADIYGYDRKLERLLE